MRTRVLALLLSLVAPPIGAQTTAPAAVPAFELRPGDVVEVFLWREQALSGEFLVDERGMVLLPVIGSRSVVGAPWTVVRDSLMAAYARELRDQSVRLTPKRRVFVLGFVQEPGAYLADPTVPIAGAIALAGGASAEGDLRRVRVMRDGAVFMDAVSLESPLALSDVRSGDQIYVERRGWFDRNSPFFVSAMVGLAGIIVTLIVAQ
jgi:protein involved in polysaccharide export with SLBB domain